jgi:hypothetical protein
MLINDITKILQNYISIKDGYNLSKTNIQFNIDFKNRIQKYFTNKNIGVFKKEIELIKYLTYLYNNSPEQIIYYQHNKIFKCKELKVETCDYCTILLNLEIFNYKLKSYNQNNNSFYSYINCNNICVQESVRRKCSLKDHPEFSSTCDKIYDICLKCDKGYYDLYCPFQKNNYYLNRNGTYLFSTNNYYNHNTEFLKICESCFRLAKKLNSSKFKNRLSIQKYKLKSKDKNIYIKDSNDEYTNTTVNQYLSTGNSLIEWDDF